MTKVKENPAVIYQDTFLENLKKTEVSVGIYLLNGIKLQGKIVAFDNHVIILRAATISQIVFKHAILTILPI